MLAYQTNMERILAWILKLEEHLDKQEDFISNDLKTIKEQFQNHEVRFDGENVHQCFSLRRNL